LNDQSGLLRQFQALGGLPVLRQLGLLVGLAASVALGVGVVLWSRAPDYSPLFGGLSNSDANQIVQMLEQDKTPYRLDSGTVSVPAEKIHELRLKLASAGLPRGEAKGFEMLDGDQGFGTSSFMESTRYHRALEGELAKSVATLDGVSSARVHLAIPKQTAFLRKTDRAAASVLVNLGAGRGLSEGQVSAVVHLVASSVPGLDIADVTVVDQKGRLLSANAMSPEFAMTSEQFNFTRKVEQDYRRRIVDLLAPLVGANRVSAEISADIDFTRVEKTSETYEPDATAIRSEQISEDVRPVGAASGVPGALTNQPPAAGTIAEPAAVASPGGALATAAAGGSTVGAAPVLPGSRRAVKNYELDRTISHVRESGGALRRLSVAVAVDYRDQTDASGAAQRVPIPAEELDRLTGLVKEAVGFNAERGDSVNLVNASFLAPETTVEIPQPPFWEQPWLPGAARQLLGGIAVILIIFGVLRPALRSLAGGDRARVDPLLPGYAGNPALNGELLPGDDVVTLNGSARLPGAPASYEQQLSLAQAMANQDPKRVAQVVKGWVSGDE